MKNRIGRLIKYLILIILSIISIFPFIFMLISCTNNTVDIMKGSLSIGANFFANISALFNNDLQFSVGLKNSLIISIITTILALLISSAAGYGFEIFKSKKRERIFNLLLLAMMVPFAALMIPLFKMFSSLNSTPFEFAGIDTYLAVIIPSCTTAFLIFFFRQSTKSFPKDMIEAARIDGVSEIGIFFKIFIPSIKNTYAAAAIITFMSSWNNYLWPLICLQTPEKRTLPLIISAMASSQTPDYGMVMCGIVISTIPIALMFFLMQKHFVQGMIGSVK